MFPKHLPRVVGGFKKIGVLFSIEISKFDIYFEPTKALKAQVFSYFLVELTPITLESFTKWNFFIDGSLNSIRSGSNIIIESDEGLIIEVSLHFKFSTTYNLEEYKAFIVRLILTYKMGEKKLD